MNVGMWQARGHRGDARPGARECWCPIGGLYLIHPHCHTVSLSKNIIRDAILAHPLNQTHKGLLDGPEATLADPPTSEVGRC